MAKNISHMWTKSELKRLLSLWDTKTVHQLADEFGVKTYTIQNLAARLRKAGAKISKKNRVNYLENLIKEVVADQS